MARSRERLQHVPSPRVGVAEASAGSAIAPGRGWLDRLAAASRSAACTGGLAAAVLLAGCGTEAPPPAAQSPASPAAAPAASDGAEALAPEVVAARERMPQAVTVGAATAPVELRYEIAEAPQPNRPFTLELAVLPETALLSLRAAVSGSPGLEVVSPADGVAFERLQAGTLHRFTVTAVSATPGTRVVNVTMTLELPTGPATRTFGVPVVVGATAGA